MVFLKNSLLLAAVTAACLLSGCTKEQKTVSGALIGAGSGALIGGAAGGAGGAVAGGAIGGVAGGLIGHSLGDDEK